MGNKRWLPWAGLLLVGAGTLLILLGWPGAKRAWTAMRTPAARLTSTPEPLLPTRTPASQAATTLTESSQATPTSDAHLTSTLESTVPTYTPTPRGTSAGNSLWMGRPRWGIGVASGSISRYDVGSLRLGWYLDWRTQANPPRPDGARYAQMIRLHEGVLQPDVKEIAAIARANAGSLWLVGNEPDVVWQGNATPATYARLYHDAHVAIKDADPTAQVAIGGVSQPTPLRLRYLDAVLDAYAQQFGAEMPVDVWNAHNFILREERGSWGVDIPPGLPDERGMLYEVDDGGDMDIFRQQVVDLRRWMAQRGYQDKPLIVSEYGILMPSDYGFPPERVAVFMTGTFDFFSSAADPEIGYPADDYRLVQLWCWYSLNDSVDHYPTGNLYDPQTGEMTVLGKVWEEYVGVRD